MKVLTRTLTAKQSMAENCQRVIEHMTSDRLRDKIRPRMNIATPEIGEVPAPPDFNAAVRAAHRADDFVVMSEDANGIAPPPSLNAAIINARKESR